MNVMPSTILHFPFSERWNSEINYQNYQKINLLIYKSNDLTILFFNGMRKYIFSLIFVK